MHTLSLYRDEVLLARFALHERPLELGRATGCDIVVDDPDLAPRHWLLTPAGGTLVAHDISAGRRCRGRARQVPLGARFALGRSHDLLRECAARGGTLAAGDTLARAPRGEAAALLLRIGTGGEARRIVLDDRPLHVGRHPDNDVVLVDPAVSARHCRLDPDPGGGRLLRDLDSRNGTLVSGVRVQRALIGAGSTIRVGDTDLRLLPRAPVETGADHGMVAASPALHDVLERTRAAASLPWPVLVVGESGCGKEGIARAVHRLGTRSAGAFVALNAGGLAPGLVESELFGHERGAFTGADAARRGVFEQADGGTLFLDEIGELPLPLQARLLRVLDTGELRRVGSDRLRRVDVRLVSATHRDLRAMVAEGRFREDLYYRLARLVLQVPPLRDRPADVRALAQHFMREVTAELGPRALRPDAMDRLVAHAWPGNARELRNVLSSAAASTPADQIGVVEVERALQQVSGAVAAQAPAAQRLAAVVDAHRGNLTAAARVLGMPRSTLRDRLRRYARSDPGQA